MKLLLIIILVIFFAPLPIKITLFFSKENYYIKIYRFSLLQKKKKGKPDTNNISNEPKDTDIKNNKKKSSFFKNITIDGIMLYIKEFKSNKFKPRLKIDGYFNYSFADAAKTAIFYGHISTCLPLISWILSIIFKTKRFTMPINPIFKDEIIAEIKITSIITLSLAQIIYMVILFIKVTILIKEEELEGGKI